jgi:hypothetical protein
MNGSRSDVNLGPVSGSRRCASKEPMQHPLHRAAEVLQQEAVSVRTIARRMNVTVEQVRAELNPQRDLCLSDLYRWKSALNVPTADLLVHPGTGLSDSVELRASLLKAMKTVRSIQEETKNEKVSRLAARLSGQLTDLMPELKDVSSWPSVGKRRTLDELGAIVENMLPDSIFRGGPPVNGVSD